MELLCKSTTMSVSKELINGSISTDDQKYGLSYYSKNGENESPICIPLEARSVSVVASVVHVAVYVEIQQEYVNEEKQSLDCMYLFPTESIGAVITQFLVKIDDRTLEGCIKPYEDAKKQYIKVLEEHRKHTLCEENSFENIFRIDIGNVEPGEKISISLSYITQAKNEDSDSDSIRFSLPKAIAPNVGIHGTNAEKKESAAIVAASVTTMGSKVHKSDLMIKFSVSLQGSIAKIQCPSHNANISKVETSTGKITWTQVVVNVKGKITDMNRDFVLIITHEEGDKPRLYTEKIDENEVAVMVHLIPLLEPEDEKLELLFLLDRSGSMEGNKIHLVQTAIRMFLHSLPEDTYFNIVGFGSNYEFLFPKSVVYNDENLLTAEKHIKKLHGDLGGTELLDVLKVIYEQPRVFGHLRHLFILTDGEIFNTSQVISLVRYNAHHTRVFSLGIGKDVSSCLVKGLAQTGNGTFHFVKDNEQMDVKILDQLRTSLLPSLKDIFVNWDSIEYMSQDDYFQAPLHVPPVMNGFPLLIFGIFSNDDLPSGISISGTSTEKSIAYKIPLDSERQVGTKNLISALAAAKVIKELESQDANEELKPTSPNSTEIKEQLKQKIIDLSIKYGIVSKYTTYVLMNEDVSERTLGHHRLIQQKMIPADAMKLWAKSNSCTKSSKEDRACFSRNMKEEIKFPGFPGIPTFDKNIPRQSGTCNLEERYFSKLPYSLNLPLDLELPGSSKMKTAKSLSALEHDRNRAGVSTIGLLLQENADIDDFRQELAKDSFREDLSTAMTNLSIENLIVVDNDSQSVANVPVEEPVDDFTKEMNQAHRIAFLQSSSGCFKLNAKLCDALNLDLMFVKTESSKNQWDETAWATVLAIVFFSQKIPEQKELWELVSIKGKKWLLKNYSDVLDSMIVEAQNLLFEEEDTRPYEKIMQFSKHY